MKICDVACLLFSDLKLDDSSFLDLKTIGVNTYQFDLISRKHGFTMMLSTGAEVADLDNKTSNGLRSLQEFTSIRYEAYVIKDHWTLKQKSWKRDGKRSELAAVVNIYGARAISDAVGERLSSAGIYLQHPDYCDPDSEYENPHFFKLPNVECPKPGDFILDSSDAVSKQGFIMPDYHCVFDTLSRYKNLRDAQIDSRIHTPLLSLVTLSLNLRSCSN